MAAAANAGDSLRDKDRENQDGFPLSLLIFPNTIGMVIFRNPG